jgi:hypothetical protein
MQVSGCTGRTHVVDRVAHVVRGSRMVATASATDVQHFLFTSQLAAYISTAARLK